MKITDIELKMLHLLGKLINHNDDRKEVDLSIEIFWKWKDYLYGKYGISDIKQYIDHNGTIKERKKEKNRYNE